MFLKASCLFFRLQLVIKTNRKLAKDDSMRGQQEFLRPQFRSRLLGLVF